MFTREDSGGQGEIKLGICVGRTYITTIYKTDKQQQPPV